MPAPDGGRAWLALVLAPDLGPAAFARLSEAFGDPAGFSGQSAADLARLGLRADQVEALKRPDGERMDAALAWLEAPRHYLVTLSDPLYPPLLRRIPDPPPALFVAGDPDVLVRPQAAIVGSRNATPGGLDNARAFSRALARAGFVVTSGLAAGIDGTAHRAALDAGGATIAVAGTGPDRVYPARHRDLAREIVDNGAVVSIFPPGVEPRPGNFPARNRIISGMSLGVLVVEAGVQSGSLITARLAGEQGREVFAIPGSIHNPLARGCHRLLRQGAKLIETTEEIVSELRPLAGELAGELRELLGADGGNGSFSQGDHGDGDPPPVADDLHEPGRENDRDEYQKLLEAVGFDPTAVDTIIERSGLTTQAVSAMLTMLELEGRVAAHPGGRYSRRTREDYK